MIPRIDLVGLSARLQKSDTLFSLSNIYLNISGTTLLSEGGDGLVKYDITRLETQLRLHTMRDRLVKKQTFYSKHVVANFNLEEGNDTYRIFTSLQHDSILGYQLDRIQFGFQQLFLIIPLHFFEEFDLLKVFIYVPYNLPLVLNMSLNLYHYLMQCRAQKITLTGIQIPSSKSSLSIRPTETEQSLAIQKMQSSLSLFTEVSEPRFIDGTLTLDEKGNIYRVGTPERNTNQRIIISLNSLNKADTLIFEQGDYLVTDIKDIVDLQKTISLTSRYTMIFDFRRGNLEQSQLYTMLEILFDSCFLVPKNIGIMITREQLLYTNTGPLLVLGLRRGLTGQLFITEASIDKDIHTLVNEPIVAITNGEHKMSYTLRFTHFDGLPNLADYGGYEEVRYSDMVPDYLKELESRLELASKEDLKEMAGLLDNSFDMNMLLNLDYCIDNALSREPIGVQAL